jgi:hypothetical protein
VVLAHGTSDAIAYAGVAPAALGAGKGQPVSARIVNLAEQQRLPQVCAHPSGSVGMDRVSRANNTSTFTACASLMCDAQGALAAERSTLNAIVKVVAPSTFAYVFARGSALGVPVLPFYLAAFLLTRGPYGFIGHGWRGNCNSDYELPAAFLKDYGTPKDNCTTTDNVTWTRHWTKSTVDVDCSTLTATISPAATSIKTDDVAPPWSSRRARRPSTAARSSGASVRAQGGARVYESHY